MYHRFMEFKKEYTDEPMPLNAKEMGELFRYECDFCHVLVPIFRHAWIVGDSFSCGCHFNLDHTGRG